MATTSENLGLLLASLDQDKCELILNEAIQVFDVLTFGLPSTVTGTPPGSPANNDIVLVAGSGTTGVFVGHENELACYFDGAWRYYPLPSFLWDTSERLLPQMRESENVYQKVVNIAAGPNTTTLNTAHGITGLNMSKPVDVFFYAYDGTTHYNGPSFFDPIAFAGYSVEVDATNIVWKSNVDLSGFVARVRLVYSK